MKSEFNIKGEKIVIIHGKWLVTCAHTRKKIGIIKEGSRFFFVKELHGIVQEKQEVKGLNLLKWLFIDRENERKKFELLTDLSKYASKEAKELANRCREEAPVMVEQMLENDGWLQFFSFLK